MIVAVVVVCPEVVGVKYVVYNLKHSRSGNLIFSPQWEIDNNILNYDSSRSRPTHFLTAMYYILHSFFVQL